MGGGGSSKPEPSPYETDAARIMNEQWSQWAPIIGGTGQPIYSGTQHLSERTQLPEGGEATRTWDEPIYKDTQRGGLLGDIMDIQEGGYNPQTHPLFRSQSNIARQSIDQGYRGALDDVLANTKPGGAQTDAISQMFRARGEDEATANWGIEESIINNLMGLAQSSATGAPWQASSGLTQLGQVQSQRAMANAQMRAGEKSGMGQAMSGIATGIGYAYGGPAGGAAAGAATSGGGK